MSKIPDHIMQTATALYNEIRGMQGEPSSAKIKAIAGYLCDERQRHADSVDKARAWDASQASWDKGYKRGQDDAAKAYAEVTEEVRKVLREVVSTLECYADPSGYADGLDEPYGSEETHPGLLAESTLTAVRALLSRLEER